MKRSNRAPLIAASITAANSLRLRDEIKAIDAAGVDWIHVDIMNSQFVPDFGFDQYLVEAVRAVTRKPLNVHFIDVDPKPRIESFVKAGADSLSVPVETTLRLIATLRQIKSLGKKAGVVLHPATSLEKLYSILELCDVITLMGVLPGSTDQLFQPHILRKIRNLRRLCRANGLNPLIAVDGGVRLHNVGPIVEAGADVIIADSALFKADDYAVAIHHLRGDIADPVSLCVA